MSNDLSLPVALYLVATPVGNLSDISQRAIEVLAKVTLIAAEDTRRTGVLLERLGIKGQMMAYHDHNEEKQIPVLLDKLEQGSSVALVSDAGTPVINDPGYKLVRSAQEKGFQVIPIPGACSPIIALSASGLPTDRFIYEGFLPAKQKARLNALQELVDESRTLIFLESCHRIEATLTDCATVFGGDREGVIAREMTKTYETIRRAKLADLVDWLAQDSDQHKGEFVLLIAGNTKRKDRLSQAESAILEALLEELPVSRAADLASRITGHKRNLCYRYALELQKAPEEGEE